MWCVRSEEGEIEKIVLTFDDDGKHELAQKMSEGVIEWKEHKLSITDLHKSSTTRSIRWVRCSVPFINMMHLHLSLLQTVGRRHYRSCWYSCSFGTEPQCGPECTNEEDAFWSVQDVMLHLACTGVETSDLPVKNWRCSVLKLVFVDLLVRCHRILSNKHGRKDEKKEEKSLK